MGLAFLPTQSDVFDSGTTRYLDTVFIKPMFFMNF